MPANQELTIRVTCTGIEADLTPAANAFARMLRKAVNPDGTFIDPELEAKFQEWRKTHGTETRVQDIQCGGSGQDHRALRA